MAHLNFPTPPHHGGLWCQAHWGGFVGLVRSALTSLIPVRLVVVKVGVHFLPLLASYL